MDWLSTSERLAAIDRSSVSFERDLCLHARDKFSTCRACFDLCPTGAIQPGSPPLFDAKTCVNCLACLPACPVGAFTADDEVGALLTCAARIESKHIELVCGRHPRAESSPAGSELAVQIRGCLAGLGTGAYLGLAALDLERVIVRLDACAQCEWGGLQDRIRGQVERAERLLSGTGREHRICVQDEPEKDGFERPVWDAHNPPLSRRDLFRLTARQGQVAAARAMLLERDRARQGPGRERQRILAAIRRLVSGPVENLLLDGMGFASVAISASCTACKACARSCPTGALRFDQDEESRFRLLFSPAFCVGCEVCLHVCAPGAVSLDYAPASQEVFASGELVCLLEGELARCERCKASYAARPETKLCPVCEFRRVNPFGSLLDPDRRPGERTLDNVK